MELITRICFAYFILPVFVFVGWSLSFSVVARAQIYDASSAHSELLNKRESFIIQGVLEELGMTLPDNKKVIPQPDVAPDPTPPPPKPDIHTNDDERNKDDDFFHYDFFKDADDFFAGDDDFFAGDKSFEEVRREYDTEFNQTMAAWDKEYQDTLKSWQEERKQFLKEIELYKNSSPDKNIMVTESRRLGASAKQNTVSGERAPPLTKVLEDMAPGDFFVINEGLSIPIKNQKARPTCAAFTGVRAMETIFKQNDMSLDLSEQYFYYLSKPDCKPCGDGGSWHDVGLYATFRTEGLMTEKLCPYNPDPIEGNETQIPLHNCRHGYQNYFAQKWADAKTSHLDEVIYHLVKNRPVLIGVSLSPNFYETTAIVDLKTARQKGRTDGHAGGHALILVGYVKLPEYMFQEEGRFCAVTANSWGEGWGKGGYGCLTEHWLRRHALGNHWTALVSVGIDG